jgi:hypothetical protein
MPRGDAHGTRDVGMQARDVLDVGRTDSLTAGDDPAGWVHRLESGRARNGTRFSAACKHEGPLLEVPEQSDRAGSSKHQGENERDALIQTAQECRDRDFRYRVGTSYSHGSVRSLRARGQGHRCAFNLKRCPVKSIRHPHLHQTSRPHTSYLHHGFARRADNARQPTGQWRTRH